MHRKARGKILKQGLKKHWPWMFCGIMVFVSEIFRAKWLLVFLHSLMNSWLAVEAKVRSLFKKTQNQA